MFNVKLCYEINITSISINYIDYTMLTGVYLIKHVNCLFIGTKLLQI